MKKYILLLVCSVLLVACTSRPELSWSQAMKIKMQHYANISAHSFQPYFQRAAVHYPPKQLALLVFKRSKQLQVYAKQNGRWYFIRHFHIFAASGGPGPKLRSGDHQVPEGIYRIVELNPQSRFDLSMQLDYPNAFDRKQATADDRTDLGDDIFIHGNRRSIGCIAIGNTAIETLFPLVYKVGLHDVEVIIAPNDLRSQQPRYGHHSPIWLPILYLQLLKALQQFPVPR